ncbi:hypothetical protein BDR26DRAFT_868603 [Obelidium mucronatum]|nr:hypothetical protein BDR26DRAFT_868603 [Obelidium mucronatum]
MSNAKERPRTACERCHRFKKKCVPLPTGCERCALSGHLCVLPQHDPSASHQPTHPTSSAFMDQLLKASESSLLELERSDQWDQFGLQFQDEQTTIWNTDPHHRQPACNLNTSKTSPQYLPSPPSSISSYNFCEIEDPDLLPTLLDYEMVYKPMTSNGWNPPIFSSFDGDNFLKTFFQQPPFFRLMQCTMGAFERGSAVPESVSMSYFTRAKKAWIRTLNTKSLYQTHQTVQSLFWVFIFTGWKGQPDVGRPYLVAAIELIKELQLDVDPDDSPWLIPLNLTPRQREDRRRAFWSVYSYAVIENAISSNSNQCFVLPFNANKMKPPSTINDPYPIFVDYPVHHQVKLFEFISSVKQAFCLPPKSMHDILFSKSFTLLHQQWVSLQSEIPTHWFLLSETPDTLTLSDYERFKSQQATLTDAVKSSNFVNNISWLASTCLLYRPILFLSGFKQCHPMYLSKDIQQVISTAINQSLDAAHRILNLLTFFLDPAAEQTLFPYQNSFYGLLEAMIALWYTSCRMNTIWWALLGGGGRRKLEWEKLRPRMLQTIQFLNSTNAKSGGVGENGVIPPLVVCMKAMVREIELYESGVHVSAIDVTEKITLGMKVVSLDGTDDVSMTREPNAFLGLLGMEVAGIKWPGRSEESWRLFWKLNS